MDAKTKKSLLEATDDLRQQILAENLEGMKQAFQLVEEKIKVPLGGGSNGPVNQ